MSHPGPEHWKTLGSLIVCLNGKDTRVTIIRKPKVLKAVMFCDSDYSIDKETRNHVSDLVATLGRTVLTCLSKTQRTVTLISTKTDYV